MTRLLIPVLVVVLTGCQVRTDPTGAKAKVDDRKGQDAGNLEKNPQAHERRDLIPLVRLKELDAGARKKAVLEDRVAYPGWGEHGLELFAATVVPVWLEALKDEDPAARRTAERQVRRIAVGGMCLGLNHLLHAMLRDDETLPALVKAMSDNESEVSRGICSTLTILGPRAKAAVPALVGSLPGLPGDVRVAAAEALWWIDRHPLAVSTLLAELRDRDSRHRELAMRSLHRVIVGKDGPGWDKAWEQDLPEWTEQKKHCPDLHHLKRVAHTAVQDQDRRRVIDAEDTFPTLLAVSTDPEDPLREGAARVMDQLPFSERMLESLPALFAAITDPNEARRASAIRVLDCFPPSEKMLDHLPTLFAIIADPKDPRRATANRALGRFPASEKMLDYLPTLFAMAGDGNDALQEDAQRILNRLPPSEQFLEFLAGAMKAAAFRQKTASVTVPLLIRGLGSTDAKVRKMAAERLQEYGPKAEVADPALVKALEAAVPALVKALQDQDLDARYAAGQALKRIDSVAAKKALVP